MPVAEIYERVTTGTFLVDDAPVPLTCTPVDPFGIDRDCTNAAGHYAIASCGDVVCVHCAKVFWQ